MKPSDRRSRIALACLALIPVCFLALALGRIRLQRALDTRGVTTQGRVTLLSRSGGKARHTDVGYEFTVGGKRCRGISSVTDAYYDTLSLGDPIPVTYLPDAPTVTRCPQCDQYQQAYVILLAVGIMVGGMGGGLLLNARQKAPGRQPSSPR